MIGITVERDRKTHRGMTLEDAKPGQWLEIHGMSGLHLVVWNDTGRGIVGADDCYVEPIKTAMFPIRCKVVEAVLKVK